MLIKEIKGDYNNCVGFPGQVRSTSMLSYPFPVVADPLPHLTRPSSAGWQSSLRRELCARWTEFVEKMYRSANRHYKLILSPSSPSAAGQAVATCEGIAEAGSVTCYGKREGCSEQHRGL